MAVDLQLFGGSIAENGGTAYVVATLDASSSQTVDVALDIGGTASSASDYVFSGLGISIPSGSLSGSISITAVNDANDEPDETVVVTIASINNDTNGTTTSVSATIVDDDPPHVTLSVSGSPFSENGAFAFINATLSSTSSQNVTVDLSFSGTAGIGVDYSASNTSIVVPAGQLMATIILTGINDATDELDETIIVDVNNVTNGTENGSQQVTAVLNDDDAPPTVTLSIAGSPLAENNGIATVTATLSVASSLPVTVDLSFTGTASSSSDYSLSGASILIPAGQTTGSITITGVNDTIDEDPSETVIVDVSGVTNGSESGTQQVIAEIADDDAPPTVNLLAPSSPIAENGGSTTLIATLSSPTNNAVTVNLTYSGTASGSDYNAAASIVIAAGQTSGSITITAVDDSTDEADESIVVDISSVSNGTENGSQQVSATITDDDAEPVVTLSISGSPLNENGGAATVTAALSNPSSQAITVNLGFSGIAIAGTDYFFSGSSIVIPAGQTSGTITLTGLNDNVYEGSENFVVGITSVSAGGSENGTQEVSVSITDDELPPTATLSIIGSQVAENDGIGIVTATLSNPSTQDVTVNLAFGSSALLGTDYSASGTSIVIPAGQTSGTIMLRGLDDTLDEVNETAIISIDSVTNGSNSTSAVTATILDDDAAPNVTLSVVGSPFSENGGFAEVVATLDAVSGQDVTVLVSFGGTAQEGVDYIATGTWLTIPAGSLTCGIALVGVDDTTYEGDETISIDVVSATNATVVGTLPLALTVAEDDILPPPVTLSVVGASLAENGGLASVIATLDYTSSQDVTVNLGLSGGAVSGTDYSASATSIVVPAGQISASITLSAINNTIDEVDRTIVVDISTVTGGVENGTQQQTLTILDDDATPTVSLSISPSSANENGGSATVTATLSNPSSQAITVNLAYTGTATFGQDYSSSTAIVIPAGATSASITLTTINDSLSEANETVKVDITTVTNATENGTQQVTFTITDDDRYVTNGATRTINGSAGVNELYISFADGQIVTQLEGDVRLNVGITSLVVAGFTAQDRVYLVGRNGIVENATIGSGFLSYSSGGFTINAGGGEIYIYGQAEDTATLIDSAADDTFYGIPAYSIMAYGDGVGVFSQATGYGSVLARSISGGNDTALLYDTAGNDVFNSSVPMSSLVGPGYSNRAESFKNVFAFASMGGNDTAEMHDTIGDDGFYATPDYAILQGSGLYFEAIGFDSVQATAGAGSDAAFFYDSAGNDNYISSPVQSSLVGSGFTNTAKNFDANYAYSTSGADVATLGDSAGDDTFHGSDGESSLQTGDIINQIFGFTQVLVTAGGGNDTAYFFDSTGNDLLNLSGNAAQLQWGSGRLARVVAFDSIIAYSDQGGVDDESQTPPLDFTLTLVGAWV